MSQQLLKDALIVKDLIIKSRSVETKKFSQNVHTVMKKKNEKKLKSSM